MVVVMTVIAGVLTEIFPVSLTVNVGTIMIDTVIKM